MRFLGRNFLDRDDIAAMLFIGGDALCEAAPGALRGGHGDHVRQKHREGLVADKFARAPDRVAKTQRRLLAREAGRAGGRQLLLQGIEFF